MDDHKKSKVIPLNYKHRRAKTKRVIAITSGKGGVGKTNLVANLAYAFTSKGERTLILDADLGLGNIDVILGLTPKYNLSHVVAGQKSLEEILVEGPDGIKVLPASSGIEEMTNLSRNQKLMLLRDLEQLMEEVDVVLIDTAAGISSNVMYFNSVAQNIVVVVSPEPTSITDAYAVIKLLFTKYKRDKFYLVANFVRSSKEGTEIYRQLRLVTDRFLKIELKYLGQVFLDDNIPTCVKWQKILVKDYPESVASRCFLSLAERLISLPESQEAGESGLVWGSLLGLNGN